MKQDWEKMVDRIKEAYIKVMGLEKWNSLTDQQKHDAVMIIVRDALNQPLHRWKGINKDDAAKTAEAYIK